MSINYNSLLVGIQLMLGLQLIVVGILHLIAKDNQSKVWLAVLYLIFGLWFIKPLFNFSWYSNIFLFVLVGPGKPIFVGSLLLLHFKKLTRELGKKNILFHLIIPTIYYTTLLIVHFYIGNNVSAYTNFLISLSFSFCLLAVFSYYFYRTKKEILTYVKLKLIPKAYKRITVLFYSLYFFLLQIPIWDIIEKLFNHGIFNDYIWAQVLYERFLIYVGSYAAYTYLHFLGYFVFLYAAVDLPYIKRLLLPKQTNFIENSRIKKDHIKEIIEKFFLEEKAFKNPDLTIDNCISILGISRNELVDYLNFTYKMGFRDFINNLRVDEVKLLIRDSEFSKYDFMGIAFQCGFRSKSTFHRVFKEIEGITPREFKLQTPR